MDAQQNESSALAIDGGQPVRSEPLAPWPVFDDEMIEAAAAVLRSGRVNYWTGEECRHFEREYASAVGIPHAVALANGTLALELALLGLGIGPGDDVVVPVRTFVATGSSVIVRGARPVFADVDEVSQNVTADTIAAALTPRTRAVIVVHLAGWPCEMEPILEIARSRNLKVIEDCAQAHGASHRGRAVGAWGDAAAFSFCQDKILTTGGEGGLLTTSNPEVWERAWSYKDHGKSWKAVHDRSSTAIFKWVHESFGSNWRMTEMQAAIGRVMLRRLPAWVDQRRNNAAILHAGLAGHPALVCHQPSPHCFHSYYKWYAFLKPDVLRAGWSRDRVVRAIQAEGVACGSGSCSEIYRETCFAAAGLQPAERLPTARRLGEQSLMFLVHPTLSRVELEETCRAVRKVLSVATQAEPVELSLRDAA